MPRMGISGLCAGHVNIKDHGSELPWPSQLRATISTHCVREAVTQPWPRLSTQPRAFFLTSAVYVDHFVYQPADLMSRVGTNQPHLCSYSDFTFFFFYGFCLW